ncbi:MAG: radical SAM protein [Deltaproteobacteria bacterium]|nr:radical SAM protein [Deltaproteobacteria bacterium]
MSVRLKVRLKELLQQEQGAVVREWGADWPIALVYPHLYPVALGNLGFQAVYHLLNRAPGLVCERAFLPDEAELAEHRRTRTPILTLESQRPLRDFGAVAFSVSFEPDYPQILKILELSGIPLLARDRGPGDPWVVAGGVAAFLNPEPLAPFVDAFLLGEAEVAAGPAFQFLARESASRDRESVLRYLAQHFPGLYVPGGYQARYHPDGTLAAFEAGPGFPLPVRVPRVRDLGTCLTESRLLTPRSEWGEMFLVEVGRGCSRSCRFCAAGFVYRPPRERAAADLLPRIREGLRQGRKIGLVGTAVSDHPELVALCREVVDAGGRLGIGSLRADAVDRELADLLAAGGVRTAALAPEAGSARLRRVLNKGLDEGALAAAVVNLIQAGVHNLRFYFMVGLPTETLDDVREIPRLVKRLEHQVRKESRGRRMVGQTTLSLSSFAPKPFTPFQWVPFAGVPDLKERLKLVRRECRGLKHVRVHTDLPKWAYTQALLARGDRRVGELLLAAHRRGWPQALRESPLNPDFFVLRERRREELFPWDFLDHAVDKNYLWEEYQLALAEKESPPCRPRTCRRCGACGEGEEIVPGEGDDETIFLPFH